MIAPTVLVKIGVIQLIAGDGSAKVYGLQHRTVAEAAAADVISRSASWVRKKLMKCLNQVGTMDIVANLLSLVAEDRVRRAHNGAFH
jgi:hypothetical protein